jgi:EAL domain-containing protein (putative c-di-GMP-specific phosphodiesterase class I)
VLLRALDTLWLAVQPIVSTTESRVVAYEALMRTHDAELRDPGRVLGAAERLEMLPAVGRAVRNLAAAIVPTLPSNTDLFINLHPHDLLDAELFSAAEPLAKFARRVVLEVTERSSLHDIPDARGCVNALKQMGYRIALDDMGAGYAGLTTFAMLKPDFVKIDLALVRDVDTDGMKQTLIRTIVGLAQELGVHVIAEGVETMRERHMLQGLGCTLQQGYLFARPAAPFPKVRWH